MTVGPNSEKDSPFPMPTTDEARERQQTRRSFPALFALAALVTLGAVLGVALSLREGFPDRSRPPSATYDALAATGVFPDASGRARATRTDSGWRIELDATGLPRRDGGQFYQAWLRNDDMRVSIGTFNEGEDVTLWAGVSPADFPTLTVTQEDASTDPASSGRPVLVGRIKLP
jgi:hypothetical protein